jgi:hypothetical protein
MSFFKSLIKAVPLKKITLVLFTKRQKLFSFFEKLEMILFLDQLEMIHSIVELGPWPNKISRVMELEGPQGHCGSKSVDWAGNLLCYNFVNNFL